MGNIFNSQGATAALSAKTALPLQSWHSASNGFFMPASKARAWQINNPGRFRAPAACGTFARGKQ
jgi:hypothetical protein